MRATSRPPFLWLRKYAAAILKGMAKRRHMHELHCGL